MATMYPMIPAKHLWNDECVGSTANFSDLTTDNIYSIRVDKDSKVGVLVYMGAAASSANVARIKVQLASSSDLTITATGYVNTTGMDTHWIGPCVSASSHSAMFLGPFETMRFNLSSNITPYKTIILYYDSCTGNTITESTRYNASTDIYLAPKIFAYQLP